MITFSKELKKIMACGSVLMDQKEVGRFLYGRLGDDLRAKLEFCQLSCAGRYAGIKITVIDPHHGIVDSVIIEMFDILGMRAVGHNVYKQGVRPYIEEMEKGASWHVFIPSKDDYQKLYEEVEKYLSVF